MKLVLSSCSSVVCMCVAVIVALYLFKKDVCKKFPEFPLLCKKLGSGGSGGGGGGPNVGTPVTNGTSGKANISTFGGVGDDNDEGFIGVNLKNWKGVNFRGKPVIPVAVHMDHGASFIYKVLEIHADTLPMFYGFVVDLCDVKASSCKNKDRNGIGFLIDIHKSGWPALGLSESQGKNYLKTGTYTVIGEIKSTQIPKNLWMPKVQSGKDSMVCSCAGSCTGKNIVWKGLGKC